MSAAQPMGLTQRQGDVLAFVRAYVASKGRPPALREIAAGIGIRSIGRIHELLCALETRGHIKTLAGKTRSLVLISRSPDSFVLPPNVQAELDRFCTTTGEQQAAVVADAVMLHLDELARDLAQAAGVSS